MFCKYVRALSCVFPPQHFNNATIKLLIVVVQFILSCKINNMVSSNPVKTARIVSLIFFCSRDTIETVILGLF